MKHSIIIKTTLLILFTFWISSSYAQDLEPRSLSSIPIGGNFAIASYGYSTGNILVDNSLPIENLDAQLHNAVFAYAHSFKLFNKLAKFDAIIPYSFGTFTATVIDADSSTSRNGFADPLLRLSVVLIGGQPLSIADFIKHEQNKFKLGAVFRLRLPLGQYDPTKFINLGANRWAFKLGIASSYTFFKKLTLELHANSWFFTENKEFFNGNTIRQKPLLSLQLHITYVFKPGVWIALSTGRSGLGETIVNGVEKNDLQQNSRIGLTFAHKLSKHHALKAGITSGISTRYGANFTTVLIAYQFMWFSKTKQTK